MSQIKDKKKIRKNKDNIEYRFLAIDRYLPFIFYGSFLLLAYFVFCIYRSCLYALGTGLILYIIFRKPYYHVYKYFPYRTITAGIASILVVTMLAFPVGFLLVSVFYEMQHAYLLFQNWATPINIDILYKKYTWLESALKFIGIDIWNIESYFNQISNKFYSQILTLGKKFGGNIITILFNGLLSVLVLFFLFKDGSKIKLIIYKNLPFPIDLKEQIGDRIVRSLDVILKGTLVIAFLQGIMVSLLFLIFGLPLPLMYGLLGMCFSLIPVIGTAFVWLPAALFLYLQVSLIDAVIFSILSYLSYLLLENIFKPWLLDKKLPYHLHPFFLFLSVLGGIAEFGIKGFVLGPFIVIVFLILWELISIFNEKHR